MTAFANLPRAVATFLKAIGKRDGVAVLAAVANDAVLVDGGVEHRGNAIREWHDRIFLRAGTTVQPIDLVLGDGQTVLTVIAKQPDQGMTPAQFDWRFAISDGKISAVTIVPTKLPELPAPAASYVVAANAFNLEALVEAFAEHAMVNDQLLEHWGKQAIRKWAARDIIGDRVTMCVVKAVEHHGNAIVTAVVDGDYDKRGLPDPLVVTFYFSLHGDKIIQLIILRNEPAM